MPFTKPTQPVSFDPANLAEPFRSWFIDHAFMILPLWEAAGTTVECLKSGVTGQIIDGPGDGLGPAWGSDADRVWLEWPGDQDTTGGGRCISFSGTALETHDYTDVTILAVFESVGTTVADDGIIFFHHDADTDSSTHQLELAVRDDTEVVGHSRIVVQDGGTNAIDAAHSLAPVMDEVEHVMVGRRGVATDEASHFTDGALDETQPGSTGVRDLLPADDGPFIGDIPNDSEQLKGRLMAVYVFDTALTDAEIADLSADPYGMIRQADEPDDTTAPTVSITSVDSPVEGEGFDVVADISDAEGNLVAPVAADCQIQGGASADSVSGSGPYTFGFDSSPAAGGYTVEVSATDTAGNPASDTAPLTVQSAPAGESPPVVNIGVVPTPVEGESFSVTVSISDPDGDLVEPVASDATVTAV